LTGPAAVAARPKLALILSGGGARAAYQAGVARAISEMLPDGSISPFRIVCGTSAGAINAASLAAGARHFRTASSMLCETWATLGIEDIYRADGWHLAQTGWRWLFDAWSRASAAGALLDTAAGDTPCPDHSLSIDPAKYRCRRTRRADHHCIGYRTGMSVSFCMGGAGPRAVERSQRIAWADIGVFALLASSAIPFVFRRPRSATSSSAMVP
jgi:NTE family protein